MASENSTSEMARRRHSLLIAIVQDHVAKGGPVGSKHIAHEYSLGVRAATVRSMMSELEEEGFLVQPHTSAGRVPTDKAFRYYVDNMMSTWQVGKIDRSRIEFCCSGQQREFSEVIRDSTRLLSLMTGQAAMILTPKLESAALEQVSFIHIRPKQVLAVFAAIGGRVYTRLIDTDQSYTQVELDRMAGYLNEMLHGRTLIYAKTWIEQSLKEERARYDRMVGAALTLGGALVSHREEVELYIEGSVRVLEQPEFADPARLREMLRTLEDKTALLHLLESSIKAGCPTISIGSENGDTRLNELSIVAAAYAGGPSVFGSLAIVGPVRMDYGRVVPLVEYTAKALSRKSDTAI